MGKYIEKLSKKTSAIDKKYKRPLYQTYLTSTEWRNVEMSEEYAEFLREGNPFYRFPFFYQILVFWKVFFQSYHAARKEHGHLELIFSDYMLMNLFIGINTTLEFLVKGIISLLLWPFLRKKNESEFQTHIADVFKDYADFIHHTPFYSYSYFTKLGELYKKFWRSEGKTFSDVVSLLAITIDFIAHGVMSLPAKFWATQESNKAPETIDVIVKFSMKEYVDETFFSEVFRSKIQAIKDVSIVNEAEKDQLFIRQSLNPLKKCTYGYARLRVPRYEAFQNTIKSLAAANISVREIAGQHHIQCKIVKTEQESVVNEAASLHFPHCEVLFSYKNGVNSKQTFFAIDVPTAHLKETLEQIEQDKDRVQLKLMHDF